MTQLHPEEIAKSIESGRYFSDAREWYAIRYLSPIFERSILAIICCIITLIFFIQFVRFFSIFPIQKSASVVVEVDDIIHQFPQVLPLNKKGYTAWQMIGVHLSKKYVAIRESYSYEGYYTKPGELQRHTIKRMSRNALWKSYQFNESTFNASSLVNTLGRYVKRTVIFPEKNVFEFKFVENVAAKLVIYFNTIDDDSLTNQQTTRRWKADIHYRLPQLMTGQEKPLSYLVTHYKVTELN